MLEWFKARVDWHDGLQNLSDTEAGRFAKALWKYVLTGEEDRLTGKEQMMFAIAQGYLRREEENRQSLSTVRSAAGKMGGRPKKQAEAKKANAFFEKQNKAKKADKEEDKDTTTPLPPSLPDAADGGGSGQDLSFISAVIPGMTYTHWEELRWYLDKGLDVSVAHYAVDEAAAHASRTWAYVRSILERCLTMGITTGDQARAAAQAKAQTNQAAENDERKRREDERMLKKLRGEEPA